MTVCTGDVALFTYVYRPDTPRLESPKPYLHPIRTLTATLVDDQTWTLVFDTAGDHGDEGTAALADHGRAALTRQGWPR